MGALLLLVLLTTAPCYLANDSSPGWEQVTLPSEALGLAAPDEIEQFRTGESVTVFESHDSVFLGGRDEGAGITAFDFALSEGAHTLDLTFTESLKGAKVDVTAYGEAGWMVLIQEQRTGGNFLPLTWGPGRVSSVVVRVHHHLRKEPVLQHWRSLRRISASRVTPSEAFKLERSLYYRQPAGPAVLLCQDPQRELSVQPGSIGVADRPRPVLLIPRP